MHYLQVSCRFPATVTRAPVDRPVPRKRHVKCDESKPECQRCLKWRGHCDGYEGGVASKSQTPEPSRRSRSSTPGKEKVKLPKWYPNLASESNKLLDRPEEVCISQQPSKEGPRTDKIKTPDSEINGFDEAFWTVTAPHLFRHNASVWYANLAIHALVDAKRPNWGEDRNDLAGTSYRRALRYHGLALGQLRKEAISRGSLQSATLCCLFFVIFEMMNEDEKAAQAHMYNGCRMLEELNRNAQSRPQTSIEVEAMLHTELRKALRFVAQQVNGPGHELLLRSPRGTPGEGSDVMMSSGWFELAFEQSQIV